MANAKPQITPELMNGLWCSLQPGRNIFPPSIIRREQ